MIHETATQPAVSGRDFSGMHTQYVVKYLEARAPEGTLEQVLRSTGETRTADLQAAVGTDQFLLLYQPIYNLVDLTVVGMEALLRWHHPTRGLLEPKYFIPVLEATGLIIAAGRWVLLEACRQAMEWRQPGQDIVPLEMLERSVEKLERIVTSE